MSASAPVLAVVHPVQRPVPVAAVGRHGQAAQRVALVYEIWESDECLQTFDLREPAIAFADAWNRRGTRDRERLIAFLNEGI